MNLAEARALALAAQGFAARPATVDQPMLRALVEKLGVVQIDSVNVLSRSHYLPAFSRLGSYDRDALDALAWQAPRALFEYWAHEASLVPVGLQPFFRFRMANAHKEAWGHMRRMAKNKQFVADVLAVITEKGPIAASEIEVGEQPKKKKTAGWWSWSKVKVAVEYLFWSGQITSAYRKGFERHYTTWDKVLPTQILDAPTPAPLDAKRLLVERAARAMGLGTEADLRDYYRLDVADTRKVIGELVDAGTLLVESVEGWTKPAYRHRDATSAPVDPTRAALLSPFDNLIWMRDRTDRLFGMKFRLEIYTPAPKRVHGYYVLPFLLGDALVARVDLKADRKSGTLLVHAAHGEPKIKKSEVAVHLAGELARLARWLGLAQIHVAKSGDLGTALGRAVKR